MKYQLVKQVRDNELLRESFLDLALKTFDLSFAKWYQAGYWSDKYQTYSLVDGEKVISNASVNQMSLTYQGQEKNYIQIGTVMTAEDYRDQGLAKYIIEQILKDYADCDGVYLFANDTVLDFYPKFGFQKVKEYQAQIPVSSTKGDFVKLDLNQETNQKLLETYYQRSNPYSKLSFTDNYGLLMFYCGDFMSDCVYYSKSAQMIVIGIQNRTTFECFDILGYSNWDLQQILNSVVSDETDQVNLGFTPLENDNFSFKEVNSDETLFVYQDGENIFSNQQLMFPLLSHA